MNDNHAKQRIISLMTVLFQRTDKDHTLTTQQIIRILTEEYNCGVNRNTLTTDIKLLIDNGVQIEAIHSSQNHYYYKGHPFELAELKLLIDAVASSKFISDKKSREIIAKLCALTNQYEAEKLHRNIYPVGNGRSDNSSGYATVDVINDAIDKKTKISFQYIDYNTSGKKILKRNGEVYKVSPYAMIYDGDYYYVIGWCDNREEIRNFRMDRISRIPKILSEEEYVEKPGKFDINEYRNTAFRMFGNGKAVEVTLQGEQETMKGFIDQFGKKAKVKAIDKEHFEAVVKVVPSPTFYRWVFGWNGKMKIRSPLDTKEEYRKMLNTALE